MRILGLTSVLLATAAPAAVPAASADQAIAVAASLDAQGVKADILVTNSGAAPITAPDRIGAILRSGSSVEILNLLPDGPSPTIAPGGFARLGYHSEPLRVIQGGAMLTLVGSETIVAVAGPEGMPTQEQAMARQAIVPGEPRRPTATAEAAPPPVADQLGATPPPLRPNNPLLGNLSTYNPIYAVLGHGTDTDAKLELSFKYQLLGHPGDGHWYSGFHFAYTQRMFWDVAADSAPFRDVNYQPEFLYIYTLPKNEAGDQLSLRGGFLHESNGRDGTASRGYNYIYVQPTLDVPIGSWTASIGPRVFKYVIGRDNNPDIARYRGHQALAFSIGQDQGLKLSTWSRLNFSTGKGSVDADLSYPLTGIWHDLPLYVVVQGFTGYGEDLLDYDRKQTRLRVGIGIVR